MDSRFASIRYANCPLKPLHGNDGYIINSANLLALSGAMVSP